ncbi:hypothetical protein CPB85DRAFT_1439294 [Mucidula mucida]|nr:hypothetical protein CPB85DRAFT_1439294 [Mucidula mucida]
MDNLVGISLRRTDGNDSRHPTLPTYERVPLEHVTSLKWRRAIATALIKHTAGQSDRNYILSEWPEGYSLYYHTRAKQPEGVDKALRRDTYLIGGPRTFRTPAEFIPHAIYLNSDSPIGKEYCQCCYCSGKPQKSVSTQLVNDGLLPQKSVKASASTPIPQVKVQPVSPSHSFPPSPLTSITAPVPICFPPQAERTHNASPSHHLCINPSSLSLVSHTPPSSTIPQASQPAHATPSSQSSTAPRSLSHAIARLPSAPHTPITSPIQGGSQQPFPSTVSPGCIPMQVATQFTVSVQRMTPTTKRLSNLDQRFRQGDIVWTALSIPLPGLHGTADSIRFWPGMVSTNESSFGTYEVELFTAGTRTVPRRMIIPYHVVPLSDALMTSIGRFTTGSFPIELKYLPSCDPRSLFPCSTWEQSMGAFILASQMASAVSKHWAPIGALDNNGRANGSGMWWGAEKIIPGDIVRLSVPRKQLASSRYVVPPAGPGPRAFQESVLVADELLGGGGANERVVLMQIHRLVPLSRTPDGRTHHIFVGALYELADKEWEDSPSRPPNALLPPAPSGYRFRPILQPGFEALIHPAFIQGRYYSRLGEMIIPDAPSYSSARIAEMEGLTIPKEIQLPSIYSSSRRMMVDQAALDAHENSRRRHLARITR